MKKLYRIVFREIKEYIVTGETEHFWEVIDGGHFISIHKSDGTIHQDKRSAQKHLLKYFEADISNKMGYMKLQEKRATDARVGLDEQIQRTVKLREEIGE